MTTELSTYEQQAIDFLTATGIDFKAEFVKNDFHFSGDKDKRDIYKITLSRGGRKYSFEFGQSLNASGKYQINAYKRQFKFSEMPKYGSNEIPNGYSLREVVKNPAFQAPTAYSVLACLQKYEVGTLEDFISEFGYEFSTPTEYKAVKKTYKAVCKEFDMVQKLWSESEIEQLQEIQ